MWQPRRKDIKQYPHFDAPLKTSELTRIANDPDIVTKNAFFPLISFEKQWQPYRGQSIRPDLKVRSLRYSSHRDAAIYAKYRADLVGPYEELLVELGISRHVIGYRRIPESGKSSGKTNIHFSRDAFKFIAENAPCTVVIADISSFFECMDHDQIKRNWARLLKKPNLPDDHFAVFKQVTQYRVIKLEQLYLALGYAVIKNGIFEYTGKKRDIPKQLTDIVGFRGLFDDNKPKRPTVEKNTNDYGIPQGLPISDLIANFYMLDFDVNVGKWCESKGGFYQRYSDDIICVIPGNSITESDIINFLKSEIAKNGSSLEIKDKKVNAGKYLADAHCKLHFSHTVGKSKNGIDYLGFRFDGNRTYLRDKTLSNLNRKFKNRIRGSIASHMKRYKNKDKKWLYENFDIDQAISNFIQREKFEEATNPKSWTFWTYARKSEDVLHDLEPRIYQQLRGFKRRARGFVESALLKQINALP